MNTSETRNFAGTRLAFRDLAGICQAAEPTDRCAAQSRSLSSATPDRSPPMFIVPHGAGPFPGMLVVHGGAWRMGARADLAAISTRLAEHGYTAVAIDYRLAPKYKFPAQIYDCQAAVRWMRSHAERIENRSRTNRRFRLFGRRPSRSPAGNAGRQRTSRTGPTRKRAERAIAGRRRGRRTV